MVQKHDSPRHPNCRNDFKNKQTNIIIIIIIIREKKWPNLIYNLIKQNYRYRNISIIGNGENEKRKKKYKYKFASFFLIFFFMRRREGEKPDIQFLL